MICVTTDVTNLGRATEKYLGLQEPETSLMLFFIDSTKIYLQRVSV